MKRYPKHLGHLACDRCGRERADAHDKAAWAVVIRLGFLATVVCPRCQGGRS